MERPRRKGGNTLPKRKKSRTSDTPGSSGESSAKEIKLRTDDEQTEVKSEFHEEADAYRSTSADETTRKFASVKKEPKWSTDDVKPEIKEEADPDKGASTDEATRKFVSAKKEPKWSADDVKQEIKEEWDLFKGEGTSETVWWKLDDEQTEKKLEFKEAGSLSKVTESEESSSESKRSKLLPPLQSEAPNKESPRESDSGKSEVEETVAGGTIIVEGGVYTKSQIGGTSVHHHYYHLRHSPDDLKKTLSTNPSASVQEQLKATLQQQSSLADPKSDAMPDVENRDLRSNARLEQQDDIETRFRNLNGGMVSVSKSTYRIIGAEKHQLQIGGCSIMFREGSFLVNTKVYIELEIDGSIFKGKLIAYTPTLRVIAKGLMKKVHIQLPSWCISNGEAYTRVWHRSTDATWRCSDVQLPITDKPFFEFDWGSFSDIVCGNDPASQSSKGLLYCISCGIYTSLRNEISIAFHLDDRGASSPRAMVDEWVEQHLKKMSRKLKISFDSVQAKFGEEVAVKTKINKTGLKFIPKGPFKTKVDERLVRNGLDLHSTCIDGDESIKDCIIEVHQHLARKLVKKNSFTYNRCARKMKRRGHNWKPSSNTQVFVDHHAPQEEYKPRTVAQNILRRSSMQSTSTGNKSKMSVHFADSDDTESSDESG